MKALSRRVKAGSSVGICSMIAMTCSLGLGQATPDEAVRIAEPGSLVLLGTGLLLLIFVAWRFHGRRPSDDGGGAEATAGAARKSLA